MSYMTCRKCGTKVYRNSKGKYICPKCKEEVKSQLIGWSSK